VNIKAKPFCPVIWYICKAFNIIPMKVNSKKDILQHIAQSHAILNRYGVKSIGLFGSFAKNCSTEKSDLDLLVDFIPEKKSFDNFMDLAFFLEDLMGRKVEIITPQSMSKHIGPHILREVENVYS
jgi:predicted nucleotidyltransferase